jgi:DNA-binding transcriptional LysR family regulator
MPKFAISKSKTIEGRMDTLECLRMFLEVARRNSFAGAAQHFGVSRASATKQVARLEEMLNARLLNRTTKQVGLTRAGLLVVEEGPALLARYEELKEAVGNLSSDVAGVIRVGVPPSFGTRRLLPVIKAFYERYPDIQISLTHLIERKEEEFIAQGLDVGILIVPALKDASFIAIPLEKAPQALVASPGYLREHEPIRTLADLDRCNCLLSSMKSPTGVWHFTGPAGPVAVRVKGSLRSDFGDALKEAAIDGMGVSMHPYYMIAHELKRGALEVVLPEYEPLALEVYAIYSSRVNMPVRVQLFLDFLKEWAKTPKAWGNLAGSPLIPQIG